MRFTISPNGSVQASCQDCQGAVTTFETSFGGRELGHTIINGLHAYSARNWNRIIYQLMRCAGCGKGAVAKIHCNNHVYEGVVESLSPPSVVTQKIPSSVPEGIKNEFREAEMCASYGMRRAASALFRSCLEKALKHNGYIKGTLEAKIDEAATDGVITEARRKRAHEDIRVLGNDILHDDWRDITSEELDQAHKYSQRVLEDLYDDRPTVEALLVAKKRILAAAPTS